jgi:hypothetical protein
VGEIDDDDDDDDDTMIILIATATVTARTHLRRCATLLDDGCGASLSPDKLSFWHICKFLIE